MLAHLVTPPPYMRASKSRLESGQWQSWEKETEKGYTKGKMQEV